MIVYLFSFIDGEMGWTEEEPTAVDWHSVSDGQLAILKLHVEHQPILEMNDIGVGSEVPKLRLLTSQETYHII